MSNKPGGSTAAQPDRPQPLDPPDGTVTTATTSTERPARAPATLVLALLAVGWLVAMLWSTRETINSATAGATAISLSAFALPGVISAALVCGAAVGLAVGELVTRRRDGVTLRFAATVATGLLVGLAAALAINASYADNTTTRTIAGTTAAAAIIGGALAGARNGAVVGAVAGSALGALLFVVAFSAVRDPLFDLFRSGSDQESVISAASWVSRVESLLTGLIAGSLAYGYLAWARRRAARDGATAARWPAYLVAGAGAGLLLLLAEMIIRVGGRPLIDLAAALSAADAVAQTALGSSRVDNGIRVLFIGALTTLFVFGRTLRTPAESDPPETGAPETGASETGTAETRTSGTGTAQPDTSNADMSEADTSEESGSEAEGGRPGAGIPEADTAR